MDFQYTPYNTSVPQSDFWQFKGKVDYVDEWLLMKSPVPITFLTVTYLLFVLKLGPKFMKSRTQFNLTNVLIIYNLFQVTFSCYLAYIGSKIIIGNGLVGASCLFDTESSKWTITTAIYYYFIAKVTELMDTVFFVLRKNYHQVTFLHLYHHTLMMCATWLSLKYEPSQGTIFLGTLNSYVHVIMYGYYALSAFPGLVKYLWWKKYITMMQLIQFACIILQALVGYAYSSCPPSYILLLTIALNALLFIFLFGKFYINAYVTKNQEKRQGNICKKDTKKTTDTKSQ